MEKFRNNKKVILFTLLLILLPILLSWMFFRTQQEERYLVSVIVGEGDSERWAVIQQGLEKAAKDFNAQINFYTISDVRNVEEQIALIIREREKQVDALIIAAVDSKEVTKMLQEQNFDMKIVLMQTDLEPELLYPQVIADNYQMGCDLGEQILKDHILSVGILMGNDKTVASSECLQGLQDTLAKGENIQIEWVVSSQNRLAKASWYFDNIKTNAIIALDSISTKEAISLVEGSALETKVYGVGNTESNIYFLDKGLVSALVIPNEYNMGYFSMQKAMGQVGKQELEDTFIVDHIIVTKETLYEEATQRLVFPFVQ